MHEVNQLIRQARRSWYVDGLPDLALGSLLLCASGLNLALSWSLPPLVENVLRSLLSRVLLQVLLAVSLILLLAAVLRLVVYAVLKLKAHLTYPRIGYASPLRHSVGWQNWLFRLLSFELCLAILILTETLSPTFLQGLPALLGIFITSLHLLIGYVRNLRRFYLLAAISLLMSVCLLITNLDTVLGFTLYSSLMGMTELLSGSVTLWNFLRQNPSLSQEIL